VPGFYRTAGREIVVGPQTIQAFEVAYTSITGANLDSTVFGEDPNVPVYNRPQDKAGVFAFGENR
jgi:cytochrome P450